MGLLVVIDEAGDGVVVAAREHAGGGLLFLDCTRVCVLVVCGHVCGVFWRTFLGVGGLAFGAGSIAALCGVLAGVQRIVQKEKRANEAAYNHLRVLGDADALALDDLDVVEAAEDLVLDLELGAHGELGALLDLEGLVLEGGLAAGVGEVDGDGVTAGRVHGEGENDADAGVRGVGEVLAAAEARGTACSAGGTRRRHLGRFFVSRECSRRRGIAGKARERSIEGAHHSPSARL